MSPNALASVLPIVAIDRALDSIARLTPDASATEWVESLHGFASAILNHLEVPIEERRNQLSESLFDVERTESQTHFVAICLLRLLAINDHPFRDVAFRNRAYALFDKVFQKTLYPELHITARSQTHEKQRILRDVVPNIERAMRHAAVRVNDFETLL